MQSPFYEGPIGEAIAASLQLRSVLGCFITDNGPDATRWEQTFRENEELRTLLKNQSIFIRLEQSSVEAGYLAAYCPIDAVPLVIFIKNGAVVGIIKLENDSELETTVKNIVQTHGHGATTPVTLNTPTLSNNAPNVNSTQTSISSANSQPAVSTHNTVAQTSTSGEDKGKGKAVESSSTTQERSSTPKIRLKKPSKGDDEERQRILQLLENDKKERARRKREERERLTGQTSTPPSAAEQPAAQRINNSKEIHMNIRLLSGKSLKHTFASNCTLEKDVRPWLEAHRDPEDEHADTPYTFTHLLTPLPNHHFGISEETIPLGELLPQRCTLILVPQKNKVYNAYAGTGVVSGLVGGAVSTASSLVGWLWGGSSSSNSGYSSVPQHDVGERERSRTSERDTLLTRSEREDADDEEGNTYYNGNQTSFQRPPKDQNREKDD